MPKLLFLCTEDWYFCSHRIPLARTARDAGYAVAVATRVDAHGGSIRQEGFHLIPLTWERNSYNPFRILKELCNTWRIYRREQPDIVHHIAMKPILMGTLAARLAGVKTVVNGIMGLGYSFRFVESKPTFKQLLFFWLLRGLFRHPSVWLVFQNCDDREIIMEGTEISADHCVLIRGSGVNICHFIPIVFPPYPPLTVAVTARMIKMKGIDIVVSACALLRARGIEVQLILAGDPDCGNPTSFQLGDLESWNSERGNKWLGRIDDVRSVWQRSHIAALASRGGEGIPKGLIEAAACGRPIVATDVPGCREIVHHGENGILVPPEDPIAFASALEKLAENAALRERFGKVGREIAKNEFSEEAVVLQTLALYVVAHAE